LIVARFKQHVLVAHSRQYGVVGVTRAGREGFMAGRVIMDLAEGIIVVLEVVGSKVAAE